MAGYRRQSRLCYYLDVSLPELYPRRYMFKMDYTHGRDPDANKKRVVKTELFRRGNFYGVHARNADHRPMPLPLSQLAERKDSSRNQGQYLTVGQRIRELYYSALQYGDEDETQWHFRRLLGYGSFGVAALYERREPEWAAGVGADPVTDVCQRSACYFTLT